MDILNRGGSLYLFAGVMSLECLANTKTTDKEGPLFGPFGPMKREKPVDKRGKSPRITNFVTICKPRIVKTTNNKFTDNNRESLSKKLQVNMGV